MQTKTLKLGMARRNRLMNNQEKKIKGGYQFTLGHAELTC